MVKISELDLTVMNSLPPVVKHASFIQSSFKGQQELARQFLNPSQWSSLDHRGAMDRNARPLSAASMLL